METIHGIPFFPLEFDKAAHLFRPEQLEELRDRLAAGVTQDLFVFSHGWNNNMAEAKADYVELIGHLAAANPALKDRAVILGVFWPSKRFTDHDLIPGGAASFESTEVEAALSQYESALFDDIAEFAAGTPSGRTLDGARSALDDLAEEKESQRAFVDAVLETVDAGGRDAADLDGSEGLDGVDGAKLLREFAAPPTAPAAGGGAADLGEGCAAEFGKLFGGLGAGVRNLLNLTTYYTMKDRAGRIGRDGVAPILHALRQEFPTLRVHLVGHSFGARLVSMAGATQALPVQSVVLLQGAYSHYGLAHHYRGGDQDGLFRSLVTEGTSGPIVITHTRKDLAVGLAYALASRLGGQVASGFGEKDDPYGGLGGNGAQDTPEVVDATLHAGDKSFAFEPGKVYNILATEVIHGHSDILHPEVGALIASAAA